MKKDTAKQVKNQFYVGAYQAAISTALSQSQLLQTGSDLDDQSTLALYVARSHLASGNRKSSLDTLAKLPPTMQSLAQFKILKACCEYEGDRLLAACRSIDTSHSNTAASLVAEVLLGCGLVDECISVLAPHVGEDVECGCLAVLALLRLNRLDFAGKQFESLRDKFGSDTPLIQLTEAWVNIASGGEKYQDAFYCFQELLETFGASAKILCGQAVCRMAVGKFDEASRLLQDALSKSAGDPDVLCNLITCDLYLQKPLDGYLEQLENIAPGHLMLKERELKSKAFDNAAASLLHAGSRQ
eukprot:Partr_v1_DN24415_c0_g1_i1_m66443 putative Coatomer protein complex, subunit epsilon